MTLRENLDQLRGMPSNEYAQLAMFRALVDEAERVAAIVGQPKPEAPPDPDAISPAHAAELEKAAGDISTLCLSHATRAAVYHEALRQLRATWLVAWTERGRHEEGRK